MTPARSRGARAIALALGLVAFAAHATTMLRMELAELTTRSPLVVRGTVSKVVSRWSSDHHHILTEVDLTVEETLKGDATQKTVRISQPGGVVGDIGQSVSGLASFNQGESCVLFLQKQLGASPSYRVAGMAQGKYQLKTGADGKSTLAVPESLGSATLIDRATRAEVSSNARTLSLDELRAQVKAAAAGSSR